jgi:hypothetical protein
MVKNLALFLLLATVGSSFAAIPFPYAKYGRYDYTSELRNQQDLVVTRGTGTLTASHFRKEGTKIFIKEGAATTTILFDQNHHYTLSRIANGVVEQKLVGRWRDHVGIRTISQSASSSNKFYADYGLGGSNNIVFILEPKAGFRQQFIGRKK